MWKNKATVIACNTKTIHYQTKRRLYRFVGSKP